MFGPPDLRYLVLGCSWVLVRPNREEFEATSGKAWKRHCMTPPSGRSSLEGQSVQISRVVLVINPDPLWKSKDIQRR